MPFNIKEVRGADVDVVLLEHLLLAHLCREGSFGLKANMLRLMAVGFSVFSIALKILVRFFQLDILDLLVLLIIFEL